MSFNSRVFVPGSPLLEEVDSVKLYARFAGMLAASASGGLAGYLCDASYVDSNRRQGAIGIESAGQSLVAFGAVRDA